MARPDGVSYRYRSWSFPVVEFAVDFDLDDRPVCEEVELAA
ncbi:MAG: hypothetical protein WD598_00870 [Acidimicrobiia bacterium]